ncbi:synaptopodin-2 isoform X1 [Etheostoma cragini]|uniref:synaptopodin-2 isoform X1 n=1 Tax=Etheostoma cragini TaxID=417921 RepID=UPI00155F4E15|nr:synaptopodin-2 isoform X1 [Etheostoma cragini]
MEPEAEDPDNNDNLVPWSGSDGSRELCESYNEDDAIDAEYPLDPLPAHIPMSESPESLQSQDWESAGEQYSLPELSGSEENVSYQEEDDDLSELRESITESPHFEPSPTSQSQHRQHPESEPHAGQISRLHSRSSSSSLGCAADMTLALTLTTEKPLGASNRQGPGTRNRRVESSEEGGSCEAPPASIFFGISDEVAEQAEKWNSEANTDLCRPDRHRARSTQLNHNESQSERNVKETKSKCKQIARLLTDAPNPRNKGALLFEKRRQRVKKYTLVSYGTGENKLDSKGQIEEETEVRSAGYNFVATSESDLEEEYCVHHQQRNFNLNWERVGEMEALPETKGKGVMMFAQRRKRMDDIVSEHEELRNKGLPVETLTEPERTEVQNMYDTEEMYVFTDQANYMDANLQQHVEQQPSLQQMHHLSNVPKPLVPNRTAKPFLGFHVSTTVPALPGGVPSMTKKHEPRFRVPVPINTHPQVWSPTGDIIASRDERISVPAIKTGILPESKRKATNKQLSMLAQGSHLHLQNKGERRSYIETEEDCFSLGAEACNFMQPRTIKLKNPPPVAPKPTINPSCPPWMGRRPSGEPCIPPRSPVSQPSQSPVMTDSQHYLQQQDWAQPQQMGNHWAPNQTQATLQTPANAWVPVNSSQLHLQPTTNSWSQQLSQSPVSMQARSPTHSPHHTPSPSRNKLDSAPNSVASYPPQAEKTNTYATKASQASPDGRVSGRGIVRAHDGPTMAGKGAELFAKRQSRMEKFVVDAETVQANKTRSPSPTLSLPNSYRYSSIVRAPPPLSYNPLLAPFYPPSAAKQTPSTSPKIKPKTKAKPKAAPKHLNPLDIMKHQPYQLDASLFKYNAVPEGKSPSPKPTPASKFEVIKNLKHRSDPSHSPTNASELVVQSKADVPSKSPVSGFGRSHSLSLPKRLNSVPSPRVVSPASTLGIQSSFLPAQRQTSFQEKAYKPLSPWDAASRSPIGSVDDAFVFQSLPSSVASNVKATAHRRSLPEPPDEWKRRVSLDPAAVSMAHYHAAPAFQAPFMSRTFSPEKPAFYGPPFRPAQPLGPDSRASIGYMVHVSSPTKYSPLHSAVQRS